LLSIEILIIVGVRQQESSPYLTPFMQITAPSILICKQNSHTTHVNLSCYRQLHMQIWPLFHCFFFLSVTIGNICMFFSTFSCQNRNQLKPNKRLGTNARTQLVRGVQGWRLASDKKWATSSANQSANSAKLLCKL